jgi:hypothetical protein
VNRNGPIRTGKSSYAQSGRKEKHMNREELKAYFEANPREWAKVAPIHPHSLQSIEALADKRYISDARILNFHSRKDSVERTDEADCMKAVLRLFRSDTEQARLEAIAREAEERMAQMPPGAQGPEVAKSRPPRTS